MKGSPNSHLLIQLVCKMLCKVYPTPRFNYTETVNATVLPNIVFQSFSKDGDSISEMEFFAICK